MTREHEPGPALLEKIQRFPTAPGVYLMKDATNRILYIGKAVNLRSRVRSYFGAASDSRVFYSFLVARVTDVDCLVAESEAEALILENNLIKKHRPLFNVRLKDDKTYVSIKVTLEEEWPRVLVVRRYKRDGNLYFGPYGSAGAVREMLRVIKTVFPLRTCSNAFFKGRSRPCIEHEIGRCTAPCVGLVSRERYQSDVQEVIYFLRGRNQELLRSLNARMEAASAARQYEMAARLRDQIKAVEKVFEQQTAQDWGLGDLDVFALTREGDLVLVQELLVRDGRIVSSRCHSFRTAIDDQEVMASFLAQFYLAERYIPPAVLCNVDFPERPLLEEWLRDRRGVKVEISVPERGDKARLVELARKNALNAFAVERTQEERMEQLLSSLQVKLGMDRPPRCIECFDISNFQGSLAVGSMVTFEDGHPAKDRYRKFKIQTVVGADDFRCLEEVLERRLRKAMESNDFPDLLLIDGGKGQLSVAVELLTRLYLQDQVKVASIAKERKSRGTTERIFVPGNPSPLDLPQDSAESLYLQRIRDEAHRFAVKYHRELRKRATLRSGLEGIPGVGKSRRAALLERFGTLKGIQAASQADIEAVVGKALGKTVYDRLGKGRAAGPPEVGEAAP